MFVSFRYFDARQEQVKAGLRQIHLIRCLHELILKKTHKTPSEQVKQTQEKLQARSMTL